MARRRLHEVRPLCAAIHRQHRSRCSWDALRTTAISTEPDPSTECGRVSENISAMLRILDLHGNAARRRRSPDGSEDENVFDIRQGVAICIAAKLPRQQADRCRHARSVGTRETNIALLGKQPLARQLRTMLTPDAPYLLSSCRRHSTRRGIRRRDRASRTMLSLRQCWVRDASATISPLHLTKDELGERDRRFSSHFECRTRSKIETFGSDGRDWSYVECAQASRWRAKAKKISFGIVFTVLSTARWTYLHERDF